MNRENRLETAKQFGAFSGELEEVGCPTCIQKTLPKLIFMRADRIGIWMCSTCGLMYASPRFTESSLLGIYENQAFADFSLFDGWSYEGWKKENRDKSYITQQLKSALVKRYLTENDRVLDAGCGTGLFCVEAERWGFRVDGIDPSRMLTEIGRKVLMVSVAQCLIEDFAPDYQYKGIVLWDVLEHVYDPLRLLGRCHYLLEDDGFVFVQVPNYDGISNRFKTLLCRMGLKKSEFKHFGFPWHIYSFNIRSLKTMLRVAGFQPVLFESWSHYMKEGKQGFYSGIVSSTARKLCLSDYMVCVARKRCSQP